MDARTLLRRNHESGRIVTATVSGVLTTKEEMIRLFDEHVPSVDIITTKSFQVVPTPGNREPVICSPAPGDFGNSVGLRNPGMEEALEELKRLRGRGLRAFLNVSLAADSPENFITLVKAFDPLADLLELNFSCPHAAAGFGASIGSDKATAAEYVRRIQEAYPERKSPLIIKLTPNADDIAGIAKAVIEAGADGIAAINTVGPKLYIEPHSGAPILNNKLGGKGGASGEWVKDDAIRCIKAIRNAIGDAILEELCFILIVDVEKRRLLKLLEENLVIRKPCCQVYQRLLDLQKLYELIVHDRLMKLFLNDILLPVYVFQEPYIHKSCPSEYGYDKALLCLDRALSETMACKIIDYDAVATADRDHLIREKHDT